MRQAAPSAGRLSPGEQRALASFLAGRMPAGQLHAELCRAREEALAAPPEPESGVTPAPVPAFRAA